MHVNIDLLNMYIICVIGCAVVIHYYAIVVVVDDRVRNRLRNLLLRASFPACLFMTRYMLLSSERFVAISTRVERTPFTHSQMKDCLFARYLFQTRNTFHLATHGYERFLFYTTRGVIFGTDGVIFGTDGVIFGTDGVIFGLFFTS
jgi:hypothetical protein